MLRRYGFNIINRGDMCTSVRYISKFLSRESTLDKLFIGSEIYVGCSDGTLLRYALQATGPNSVRMFLLLFGVRYCTIDV